MKLKNIKAKCSLVFAMLIALNFLSCKNNEIEPFETPLHRYGGIDPQDIYVYLKSQNEASKINSIDVLSKGGALTIKGNKAVISLQAGITREQSFDFETEVSFDLDKNDSLTASDLKAYKQLPPEAYKLSDNKFTIRKGKISSDTLSIELKQAFFKESETYLLPVTLTKTNNDKVKCATQRKTVYFLVSINIDLDNIAASNAKFEGKLMDRSKWKYSAHTSYNGYELSKLFDGSLKSSWIAPISTSFLTIDAGENRPVKGFVFNMPHLGVNYSANIISVYSSKDGAKWDNQGTFDSYDNSNQYNVSFKKPVDARHIKFTFTSTLGSYVGYSELNAVE